MASILAISIYLSGVVYFLLALCVLALLVVGTRYLLGMMGVVVPPPVWAIVGFILFLIILLWFLGAIGGGPGGVTLR